MRLPADVHRALLAWVARRQWRSEDGRVRVDGNVIWWRGTLLAVHGVPGEIPPRVYTQKVSHRLRWGIEKEVQRLFPSAVIVRETRAA